jgi:hypothetical protein
MVGAVTVRSVRRFHKPGQQTPAIRLHSYTAADDKEHAGGNLPPLGANVQGSERHPLDSSDYPK